MSNILDSKDFGLKIYNRFPPKYRQDDAGQNFALKRYLQSLGDGGYKYIIEDINGILGLIDPDNISIDLLSILFKQYGLELFNGIPESYLRYLLPRLGEAWSKKGSLDVVEFITTSLSGVKSSIELTYDSKYNPYVNVKFEMDYNIGGYFPDNEQFNKLLKHFIPFYCDTTMVYSYLFYETQKLSASDDSYIILKEDLFQEKAIFRSKNLYAEENTAILGQAVFNKAIFGMSGIDADEYEDHVYDTKIEEGSFASPVDSLLNDRYNLLNDSFYTNGVHCFDTITIGGEKTVIMY